MSVEVTVLQIIGALVSMLASFAAMFWALQRYIAGQIKTAADDISADLGHAIDRFEEHAGKLEKKIDRLVMELTNVANKLEGLSGDHGAQLRSLQRDIDRIDRRIAAVERADKG